MMWQKLMWQKMMEERILNKMSHETCEKTICRQSVSPSKVVLEKRHSHFDLRHKEECWFNPYTGDTGDAALKLTRCVPEIQGKGIKRCSRASHEPTTTTLFCQKADTQPVMARSKVPTVTISLKERDDLNPGERGRSTGRAAGKRAGIGITVRGMVPYCGPSGFCPQWWTVCNAKNPLHSPTDFPPCGLYR